MYLKDLMADPCCIRDQSQQLLIVCITRQVYSHCLHDFFGQQQRSLAAAVLPRSPPPLEAATELAIEEQLAAPPRLPPLLPSPPLSPPPF
jgi:hypothetical protein